MWQRRLGLVGRCSAHARCGYTWLGAQRRDLWLTSGLQLTSKFSNGLVFLGQLDSRCRGASRPRGLSSGVSARLEFRNLSLMPELHRLDLLLKRRGLSKPDAFNFSKSL